MRPAAPLLRSVVRRARRIPGYRAARRSVLDRMRASETAREIASRLFAGSGANSARAPRAYPPPGNRVAGLGTDSLPVAVISLVGVPSEHVDEVIDEVARIQLLSAAFRPVIVLDCPRLDSPRRYGFSSELVIPADSWHFEAPTWTEYFAGRLRDICSRLEVTTVISVPPSGFTAVSRAILGSLR